MARDAMGLWLSVAEREGYQIPEPSKTLSVQHDENQVVVLIDVFMPPYRDNIITKSAKQTVTVPVWLLAMAKKNNINFYFPKKISHKAYLKLQQLPLSILLTTFSSQQEYSGRYV